MMCYLSLFNHYILSIIIKMSSFFSRPNDLDCGGFPRSARATYKSMRGNVLWINDKKWIFYDS